jgi:hypothetical protein
MVLSPTRIKNCSGNQNLNFLPFDVSGGRGESSFPLIQMSIIYILSVISMHEGVAVTDRHKNTSRQLLQQHRRSYHQPLESVQ